MVFLKKIEVRCQKDRYGGTQRGLFALEPIAKGERVWFCECGEKDGTYTRAQLLDIIAEHPRLDYFIRSFSYMIDDDLYALPHTYLDEKNNDECALFNHSCEPTCGFTEDGFGDNVVAVRDIATGEELTYHYGILETEASLIYNLKCQCMSPVCVGRLTFDYYRQPEFVDKFFDYMTPYLKQKVLDMKQRWYSANCYVKRYPAMATSLGARGGDEEQATIGSKTICPNDSTSTTSSNSSSSEDIDSADLSDTNVVVEPVPGSLSSSSAATHQKGLCTLWPVKKGELVAKFSRAIVDPSEHFIRNSAAPNCVVIDGNVFASQDLPEEVELTVNYAAALAQ